MKYRHRYHAGNFADVHKHVTLLALLGALQRKEKGFLYLDSHAGPGRYDLSSPGAEALAGFVRLEAAAVCAAELGAYRAAVQGLRAALHSPYLYPGSPLLATAQLRPQDRAVLIEQQGGEAHALGETLAAWQQLVPGARARSERGDGLALLKAHLPPPERRALLFIDPPYELRSDFAAVPAALASALRRFPTGVVLVWYPIKEQAAAARFRGECAAAAARPALASELWLYARDSRVALNGSGLLVVNPPHLLLERMQVWLPELQRLLSTAPAAGSRAEMLSH